MKMPARRVQYTIRGVPPEVDRILRRRAKESKRSLNETLIDELSKAAAGNLKRADFLSLAGRWQEDPEFDRVMASMRSIDREKWK